MDWREIEVVAFQMSSEGLPMGLPETVDLIKLAASLELKGASRKLTGVLRTAWRTQSCLADMRQAQGMCDAIERLSAIENSIGHEAHQHLRGGAMMTAILLYARATTTSSGKPNERGAVALDAGKLTAQQREDHDTIIRLRNSALGHVERGARIAGDYWHRDFLFAKRAGTDNWEVASASTSIGFHDVAFEALKRQVPVATAQLEAKCRERLGGATEAIRQLNLENADLERYRVDPIQWFGGYETARMALNTGQGEEGGGWLPLL
jgi:hypothetical protein